MLRALLSVQNVGTLLLILNGIDFETLSYFGRGGFLLQFRDIQTGVTVMYRWPHCILRAVGVEATRLVVGTFAAAVVRPSRNVTNERAEPQCSFFYEFSYGSREGGLITRCLDSRFKVFILYALFERK
jgi:hypothetical protein